MKVVRVSPKRPRHYAAGYSLMETVISLTSASMLMAGMATSIFVALKSTNVLEGNSQAGLDTTSLLADMAEVRFALTVSEQTAHAMTFTIADRPSDENTAPETIRYAWSGVSGDPLTWQYNSGATHNMADSVEDFSIGYYQPGAQIERLDLRLQLTSDMRTLAQTSYILFNRP